MYVLVGNQGHVALFKQKMKTNRFQLSKVFENNQYLEKETDIYSHRAGTGVTSFTSDQVTFGESHYRQELVSKFCKEIVSYVDKLTLNDNNSSIVLIGGPSFVGEFRKKKSKNADKVISHEIVKNFYTEKPHELKKFLHDHNFKEAI